jgi:hypothetical protein
VLFLTLGKHPSGALIWAVIRVGYLQAVALRWFCQFGYLLSPSPATANGGASVQWQTAPGSDDVDFTVERSTDGFNFRPLTIVKRLGAAQHLLFMPSQM